MTFGLVTYNTSSQLIYVISFLFLFTLQHKAWQTNTYNILETHVSSLFTFKQLEGHSHPIRNLTKKEDKEPF